MLFHTPIVAGDGTIYAGGGNNLYALAADGTLKWDYPTAAPVIDPPAIGLDGAILAPSWDRSLHAIVGRGGSSGGFASAPWPKARGNRANTGRAGGG